MAGRWFFVLLFVAGLARTSTSQEPPNFIVFVADDMAWEDCGAYGHPNIQTPHMDRLAQEGMKFDAAFLTCSSCSPSRCSILTGRYPHATGAGELHQPLPQDQALFTEPLNQAGYFTAAAGKWHLGPHAKSQFDLIKGGGGPGGEGHWVNVIQERPKDQPFFCWFASTDPHRNYQEGAIPTPHQPSEVVVPPIFPDTPDVRKDIALYYDEISRFDAGIGSVIQELERQEVLDNTFLLVITDNGRPFPRCKTRVNVDGVKTPFIVRFPPQVERGVTSDSLVSTVDIGPTILDFAGVRIPDSLQGVSLKPVLLDPETEVRKYAFAEHNWHDYRAYERAIISSDYLLIKNWAPELQGTPPADAVRSPTYREMNRLLEANQLDKKLVSLFSTPRPEIELYAWREDLNCFDNLNRDENRRAVTEKLLGELSLWQSKTADSFPGVDQLTPDGFDRVTGERLE
ncbi:MAG: sulfatase [Planctomycetota bacterium]|nr:sulfatase [Planctomycetota bacterium]MEC7718677.1 sulfatase [Planctomycetota bacterium]